MEDNDFFIKIWKMAFITLCIIVISALIYNSYTNYLIAKVEPESCLKMAMLDGAVVATYQTCIINEQNKKDDKK